MKELFFSVDIETNGHLPGTHQMLAIGAVPIVLAPKPRILEAETFYARLEIDKARPGAPDTMSWWHEVSLDKKNRGNGAHYEAFYQTPRMPAPEAMYRLDQWVRNTLSRHDAERAIFVANPTSFDAAWVYWYLNKYVGSNVFGHFALDLSSVYFGMVPNIELRGLEMKHMERTVAPEVANELPHHALYDAKYQAQVFVALMELRDMLGPI